MLDEQLTKIKVIYLHKLYNFVVVLVWIIFANQKYV